MIETADTIVVRVSSMLNGVTLRLGFQSKLSHHNCNDFLWQQIEIIEPKVLILLGRFAAQTVLFDQRPIGKLLGWHISDSDMKAFILYHPSYILRNGNTMIGTYKAQFEDIFKELQEFNSLT